MTTILLSLVTHFVILLTHLTLPSVCQHYSALVLLRENDSFELAKPIGPNATQSIHPFGSDRKLYIACPSAPNDIMQYEDENLLYARATCNAQERTKDQLICPHEVRTTFEEESHNEYLKLYKVGFKINRTSIRVKIFNEIVHPPSSPEETKDDDFQFLALTQLLFDTRTKSVRWVSYDFIKSPNYGRPPPFTPRYWNKTAYGPEFPTNQYDPENNPRIRNYGPISKISLVSSLDFPIITWQHVAYQKANTAPMYSTITTDWKILEYLVRDVGNFTTSLHVQTGTKGNLKLDNEDMYINQTEKIIEVPAFFWKAIVNYSPNGEFKEGIILVMENFPYPLNRTFICEDKSKESNWPANFIKTFTGPAHIYACELNQQNADFLGIPENSEFRQASLLKMKDVSVLDSNGEKYTLNLFDEFQNNPTKYYYYHLPGTVS